ncbi:MAG: glycosyltransferase, partial [Bacteroidota bacterium]|nr:glycosyltransferase [Bacteroidota bacterium]
MSEQKPETSSLPLVSLITVVFNGGGTIEKTIQSVIRQTYPRIEYIIIDGGSKDNTLNIIQKYGSHIAFWLSE